MIKAKKCRKAIEEMEMIANLSKAILIGEAIDNTFNLCENELNRDIEQRMLKAGNRELKYEIEVDMNKLFCFYSAKHDAIITDKQYHLPTIISYLKSYGYKATYTAHSKYLIPPDTEGDEITNEGCIHRGMLTISV